MSGIKSKLRQVFEEHSHKHDNNSAPNGRQSLDPAGSRDSPVLASDESSSPAPKPMYHDGTSFQGGTTRAPPTQYTRTQTDDFSDMSYLAPALNRMDIRDTEDQERSYHPGFTSSQNFIDNTDDASPVTQVRTSADQEASYNGAAPRTSFGQTDSSNRLKRSSLDKPLPTTPSYMSPSAPPDRALDSSSSSPPPPPAHNASELAKARGVSVKDVERDLGISSVIDLSNTVETHIHESIAPAVTRETVVQPVHHIREEVITREIHQDHILHRVLPVEDFEILPARHYIQDPSSGSFREVSEDQVPGRARASRHAEKLVTKAYKKVMPKRTEEGPRQFTARKFSGGDGDYREGKTSSGTEQTERWWVHPPELESGGVQSEQTYPFYFESEDPRDDGLRTQKVAI